MTDQITVSRELLRQVLDALEFFASEMTFGQRYTNEGQTVIDAPMQLRAALEQPVQEPIYWNAVLDPEQVPQQLNKRLHRCGFRHERDAKAFIESELDFTGWRYTLVPLYAAPQPALEQPVVDPVAEISGVDEYGPLLSWHTHWAQFPVGAKLYTPVVRKPSQMLVEMRTMFAPQPAQQKGCAE